MANYTVDDFSFGPNTLAGVLAAMETKLETITNTNPIYLLETKHLYGDVFMGTLIVET